MRPASFTYLRPESVEEAGALLRSAGGDARVLAGGQSLLPLLNQRLARPATVVDIGRLTGLRYVRRDGDGLRIGALTRHVDLERMSDPGLLAAFGVLAEAAGLIGHLPIRTRGTIGGSIAHAAPGSEWCLLAVLLDARIVLRGPDGERVVAAADFLLGPHRTAAAYDELVVELRLLEPAPTAVLVEYAVQRGDQAVVAAAAAVDTGADGRVTTARLALDGVAGHPVRIDAAERALLGRTPEPSAIAAMARAAVSGLAPPSDPEYRRGVAETLLVRAVRASLAKKEGR